MHLFSSLDGEKDGIEKRLLPVRLLNGCDFASKQILELIACGCKSDDPCKKRNCSCMEQHSPSTIFCACKHSCQSPLQHNYEKDESVASEGQ